MDLHTHAYLEKHVFLFWYHIHVILKVVATKVDGFNKDFFITFHLEKKMKQSFFPLSLPLPFSLPF